MAVAARVATSTMNAAPSCPYVSAQKATALPSGDQTGEKSVKGSSASSSIAAPPGLTAAGMTAAASLSPCSIAKARRASSGERWKSG